MEPSTSCGDASQKRKRKTLYNHQEVLALLTNLDTDSESNYEDSDDEDFDPTDPIDLEILHTDEEWQDADLEFTPADPYFTTNSGIYFDDRGFEEIDYVSQFLDDAFWELITVETNRKAQQFFTEHPKLSRRSIFHGWKGTNGEEMKVFAGIIILMGLAKKP
ncbi:hypothetical protein RRG08_029721 [Elysia crispata]|uniref:PiggyBac transposable element-derived protein domain-containing protein n=1 Tax=Elysia crispata TaxID=231223 RepID=A0AAE1DSH7_9GAST|nr:hypothetical protein RRG08_029721 [Elysia crispata]